MVNSQKEEDIKGFDFRRVALKVLHYWYLIAFAVLLGAGYAYYELRYTLPIYKVDGRLLVKDEFSSWGQEYFLPGMELVSSRNRLINEIGSIRSFPLMRKVMEQLPHFKVFYTVIGNIKNTELYKSSPFTIVLDSLQEENVVGRSY